MGDYRTEHLFSLRQALATYRHYLKQIAECDQEIKCLMAGLDSQCQPAPPPVVVPVKRGRGRPKGSNTADAQLRRELHRIFGTDLTLIPGIDVATVQTILSEVGRIYPPSAVALLLSPGYACVQTTKSAVAKSYPPKHDRPRIG